MREWQPVVGERLLKGEGLKEESASRFNSGMAKFSFRPYERLRRDRDYELVRKFGERAKSRYFILNYMPNNLSYHRLGLIISRKYYKKAFERNRLKRCMREWFRLNKHNLGNIFMDIVLIALPGLNLNNCRKIFGEIDFLWKRAGLKK